MTNAMTTLLGKNAIDACEGSMINIPSAVGRPGATGLYHGICGESWSVNDGTAALGPLRCKILDLHKKGWG